MKIAPILVIFLLGCNLTFRLNIDTIVADAEQIRDGEAKYYAEYNRYGSLQELLSVGLVEKKIADGKDAGFLIELEPQNQRYTLSIHPDYSQNVVKNEDNEQLSIYCDETGILRASVDPNKRADKQSFAMPPGD